MTADDAAEVLWMKTYGELNHDRLENAVYALIPAAWDYPEAKVHFCTIMSEPSLLEQASGGSESI